MRTTSLRGHRYFVIFIDDFSKKIWVYFMRYKVETFVKFKLWKAEVENQIRKKVNCIRTDNDTEYTNDEFRDFYEQHGIKRLFKIHKTP